jgi:hypothetical protein
MEEFVDCAILGEFFKISKNGNVLSKRTNKILKPTMLKTGYWAICTRVGGRKGKAFTFRIARAVMLTFIGEVEGKPIVNHKDGVKTNNRLDNLEWCTYSENTAHAIEMGLLVHKRKYSSEDMARLLEMMSDKSIREVNRLTGVNREVLSLMKKGEYKPC